MKTLAHSLLAATVAGLILTTPPITDANAATVPIASYDVTDMPLSDFGCCSHVYSGAIAFMGRTLMGCGNVPPVHHGWPFRGRHL